MRRDVAQRRHAELAPVAVLGLDVPGRRRRWPARGIVVVGAEQVERARPQRGDAAVAALVDAALLGEVGHADVVELAVGEVGAEVAGACSWPLPTKILQAALRRDADSGPWPPVSPRSSASRKSSNGGAAGDDGLLEGRQRLGDIDEHPLRRVVRRGGAEDAARRRRRTPASAASALAHCCGVSPSSLSSRIGRMLCAHRLSAAPAQPNQRLRRRLASAMALRSTRREADAARRGRRRTTCAGSWQVAQERWPSLERRVSKNSWRPERDRGRVAGDAVAGVGRASAAARARAPGWRRARRR